MLIQGLNDEDLPMCPNGMLRPIHPAHDLRGSMIDAAYGASRESLDADGELPELLEKVRQALSRGYATADRMRLFANQVTFFLPGLEQATVVEAWYFHCTICGLILPAQRMQQ